MGCRSFCVPAVAVLCLVLTVPFAEGALPGEILRKEITLYAASSPGESYSLFYDVDVATPGLFHIALHVDRVLMPPKDANKRFIRLEVQAKEDRKRLATGFFDKGGGKLEHPVDAFEMENTKGHYRVIVSNQWPQGTEVRARLVVRYIVPGESRAANDTKPKQRPDLTVERIYLTSDKRIAVELHNAGPGLLDDLAWDSRKGGILMIHVDGRDRDREHLSKVDPHHRLKRPGGSVTFVSGIKILRPAKVRAFIDHTSWFEEMSRVNWKEATLNP